MCLEYDLTEKQASKIKELARRRGYIRVWKVCYCNGDRQTGYVCGGTYKEGIHKAKNLRYEDGGWYALLSKTGARNYNYLPEEKIKVCYAKPSWIKRLGGYRGMGKVAIFTHLAFPDWDKGDMTIREFRELCRKDKP